ncbi:DUF7948 domain-containing protein [Siphonobacter aquaeclarae]|uniref:Gliding motility-associated C-terminal domain-containing protein n=1 Tax=Siphonobacter aquaeclarae TaxID=563176 RepID=A0A1G9NEU9_9BACT|nr:gliding motility-associated C-terminal domain-containing protein [Siphonobacter aquaeclarae]SDL85088.1 gliding motility-associated C-terminal domain-containing protein [Siphonobacter aquaeclarae]
MRYLYTVLFSWICFALFAENQPVSFVSNQGQWDASIRYRMQIPGGQLDLRADGLDYVFYDTEYFQKLHDNTLPANTPLRLHGVKVRFEGASPSTQLAGDLPDGVSRNYFLGNDPGRWASDVKGFGEVRYRDLYPGIDLRLFAHHATIKYEFIVRPGADPSLIRMKYEGADDLSVSTQGNLQIKTTFGEFRELNPYNYQEIKGKTQLVRGHFTVQDKRVVSFHLPDGYDKRESLVIDPELIFATFSGSYADNWGHTATYDADGNLLSGGSANAQGFPVTAGAYQLNYAGNGNGNLWDVAILKFNPTGTRLLYATYLGGTQTDIPHSLIVSAQGDLLIFGTTSSKNFPVSTNAYQKTFAGGTQLSGPDAPLNGMDYANGSDIFIARLSTDGKTLKAATYWGTESNDGLNLNSLLNIRNYGDAYRGEIMTDAQDNILVATTTPGQIPLKRPDQLTATVLKFSTDLSTLLWGKPNLMAGFSGAYGIRTGKSGDIYVCGAIRDNFEKPEDGWVARLDASGTIKTSQRLATANADVAMLLDLDQADNVYVFGISDNGQYPVTAGTYSNRNSCQFIHAFDPALSKTLFSTVIGSGRRKPDIAPTAFLVNECGNIYLAGWGGNVNHTLDSPIALASNTTGLPVTSDAFQKTTDGSNFYLALLESNAKSLLYGTFFGNTVSSREVRGDHVDGGTSRFDKKGFVYQAVCSCHPSSFPTTPGAWSSANNSSNCNNAVFKFDIDNLDVRFDIVRDGVKQSDTVTACAPLKLQFVNASTGGKSYEWNLGNLDRSTNAVSAEYTFTKPGTYTISLVGRNPLSCKKEALYQRVIRVTEAGFQIRRDTTICLGGSVQLSASGGTGYRWQTDPTLSSTAIPNPIARPEKSTTYTVEATDASGCKGQKSVNVTVQPLPAKITVSEPVICSGQEVTLRAEGGTTYRWLSAGVADSTSATIRVKPGATKSYTVQVRDTKGCMGIATATVTIDESFRPEFVVEKTFDCIKPAQVSIRVKGDGPFTWQFGNGDSLSGGAVRYTYVKPGTYQITGSATRGSCTLTSSQSVTIEPPLEVPNAVTPNGDGKNDAFVIGVNGLKLDVFNRWGKAVYQSASYQNDWSPSVAPGTYYYLITFPDGKQCKSWLQVVN